MSSAQKLPIRSIPTINLLLIEDDDGDALLLTEMIAAIEDPLFHVERSSTIGNAIERIAHGRPDAILLDLALPDASGLEGLMRLIELPAEAPIIVMTGQDDARVERELIRAGAQDFLAKSETTGSAIRRSISHAIDRDQLSRALESARSTALSASSAKSDFVASISHEIRTPMNAILGIADLLAHTDLDEQQREYVRVFQRSGKSLLSLINNVLDLSRIESGKLEIVRERFDPMVLIEETAETYAFAAHQKHLGFSLDFSEDIPAHCTGDPDRIRQVLANLIGNAVKFTESGEIRISTRWHPDGRLQCAVEDTGIGVDADMCEELFTPFEQGGERIHRQFGGTGLGLALSRELVEAMGGRISASPRTGGGSRFEFEIAVEFGESAHSRHSLESLQILIAIKNPAERAHLAGQLVRAGASVETADSGPVVLAALADADASGGSRFDSIVMDVRLPGAEVLDHETTNSELWPKRTVVILPIDHRPGGILRCDAAGQERMLKPISTRDLVSRLVRETDQDGNGSPTTTESDASVEFTGTRILVVDDSPDNLMIAEAFLADTQVDITTAIDGAEAIRIFEEEAPFDLILMDLQMPLIDGYEATREIRRLEKLVGRSEVPILALSADAFTEQRERAAQAGCNDHLAKPIDRQVLLDAVGKWTAGSPATPSPPIAAPVVTGLVPGFIARRMDDLDSLREALDTTDFERLRRIAHEFKGSGQSLGFPELSALGADLEAAAIRQDAPEIARGIERIRHELESYRAPDS